MKKLNINTNGNKKLRNTDALRFMIWNLPAVKTCPFRTPHCEQSCYARKAERVYPQVLPSREKNFAESLSDDFVENMIYTIKSELTRKKYNGKQVVFRIHESGDFYNLEYTRKWVEIARHFENRENLVFLAYTKSLSYVVIAGYNDPETFPKNFIVRSSLWDDTTERNRELTEDCQFPIYTALSRSDMDTERENGHKFTECRCDDCARCGHCWNAEHREIIVEIH